MASREIYAWQAGQLYVDFNHVIDTVFRLSTIQSLWGDINYVNEYQNYI